jgi:hypothetical protein
VTNKISRPCAATAKPCPEWVPLDDIFDSLYERYEAWCAMTHVERAEHALEAAQRRYNDTVHRRTRALWDTDASLFEDAEWSAAADDLADAIRAVSRARSAEEMEQHVADMRSGRVPYPNGAAAEQPERKGFGGFVPMPRRGLGRNRFK